VLSVSLVRSRSGEPLYVIAQTTNISDRKQVEADLMTEVGRDALTGLANRRKLEKVLEAQLERCRRNGAEASLLLLDFDRFKQINDRHGHDVGDGMLRLVARELRGRIRATDLAARIGGDEFVMLLEGAGPERAERTARELMRHFDRVSYDPDRLNLPCPFSVGSAGIGPGTTSAQEALRQADLSMYEAKRTRKNN
jgi:diguanylate cyclase (GGDEF)-like protein